MDRSIESNLIEELHQAGTWLRELVEWSKENAARARTVQERQADALELIADRLEKLGTVLERHAHIELE